MWNRTDIIESLLLALVGVAVVIESIRLQVGTPLMPQPGFFPLIGGSLLIGLSLTFLVGQLRDGAYLYVPLMRKCDHGDGWRGDQDMSRTADFREGKGTGRLLAPRSLFKATAFNHLSYNVDNYAKTRDWYMEIFGMDCVYDDGRQASVACGNPRREIYIRTKDTLPKPSMDHWAISIADFDAEQVHRVLLQWGIDGVGWDGDFAWHARDNNGFMTQVCAEVGVFPGAATRGWDTDGKIPTGDRASRPSRTGWRATGINHVSYGVPDYRRTRDFYIDMFGMRVAFEDGIKCALSFGADPEDSIYIVQREEGPAIDHIAISIADFDLGETERAIRRLGLDYRDDGDSAWTLTDLNGYRVQVCAETGVYPGAAHDFFHQTRTRK